MTKRITDFIFVVGLLCAALLLSAISAKCQTPFSPSGKVGDTEYLITTLGIPCEPGDLQFGFWPCPPIDAQGILLHVRSTDTAFDRYLITITYTDSSGAEKEALKSVPRDSDWSSAGFNIGRVRTPTLSGITISRITISKSKTAVVITPGASTFGPPQR